MSLGGTEVISLGEKYSIDLLLQNLVQFRWDLMSLSVGRHFKYADVKSFDT